MIALILCMVISGITLCVLGVIGHAWCTIDEIEKHNAE